MTILNPDEGREGGRAALYTPDTLAERWGCSGKQVRNMILTGKLRAFRIGERLLRIPAAAVEEFEACQTIDLPSSEKPGPSASGQTDAARVALRLARQTARKQNGGSTSSGATPRSRRTSP